MDKSRETLENILIELQQLFTSHIINHANHKLVNLLGDYYPDTFLYLGLPVGSQKNYEKFDNNKRYLLLINQSDHWNPLIKSIIEFHYGFLHDDEELFLKLFKKILLVSRPWNYDFDQIKQSITKNNNYIHDFLVMTTEKNRTNDFSEYDFFLVFGCPDSTDIDVVSFVKEDDLNKEPNVDKIRSELVAVGYDDKREIDVNQVTYEVKNGLLNITNTNRAGKEIQNSIYYTCKLHKQVYPIPNIEPIVVPILFKIRETSKYFLDNFKFFVDRQVYEKYRKEKSKAYDGEWGRVMFAAKCINEITPQYSSPPDKHILPKWFDVIKSMTIRFIQLILLENNIYEYSKDELAKHFSEIYQVKYLDIKWFLFRGRFGTYNEKVLELLVSEYSRICSSYKPDEYSWTTIDLDLNLNPTKMSEELYSEFILSPLKPTDKFIQLFSLFCPDGKISKNFIIECSGYEHLPNDILKHTILIDQRTEEWKELLTFYACGKNTGVKPCLDGNWISHYYNLIRGAITELMIIKNLDFSKLFPGKNIKKVTVGFLVEEVGNKGSLGIAPDLLLVVSDEKNLEVIPVEIKCIHSKPGDNGDYRRGVELARRQLFSSLHIIEKGYARRINKQGVICIVYAYLENGCSVFEAHATLVNFN